VSETRAAGPALSPQPTLTDGDVTLRAWRPDDVDAARLQHDEEMAHWFGFDGIIPSAERHRAWIADSNAGYADGRRTVVFAVEHGGRIAGSVDVRQRGDGVGDLSWAVYPDHRGHGVATRAVRLLIDYCFSDLELVRVQAAVEVGNLASLRTAGRVGLRREGVARSAETIGNRRPDLIQLARLRSDPPPTTAEGFRGVLNAMLPLKRVISQGLIRNADGDVLLCELTYKREWDLPGGVVDPHESPGSAVAREIREELGLTLPNLGLRLVNWLPPWRGWDDAVLFVFDLGVHPRDLVDDLVLERREIRAVHWCTLEQAVTRVAPYLADLLPHLLTPADGTSYLESGVGLSS
jgi:RimJ/RimL family protein N-acetyltransferase/8-oxo-dGTP pyrophosphatase MutT (NUDIX family)